MDTGHALSPACGAFSGRVHTLEEGVKEVRYHALPHDALPKARCHTCRTVPYLAIPCHVLPCRHIVPFHAVPRRCPSTSVFEDHCLPGSKVYTVRVTWVWMRLTLAALHDAGALSVTTCAD